MRINKKRKEKMVNLSITGILILFAFLIIFYTWYDLHKVKKHIEECKQICGQDEVIENLSFDNCVCKKVLKVEDTI